jgi:3-oxoacyl-[acyl-carrier-protein] synthase II
VTKIVVTGIGMIAPNGNTTEDFWRNTVAGVSGIGPIQSFDPVDIDVKIAGEVKGFNAADFIDAKTARRYTRFAHFALACGRMALDDAQLKLDGRDPTRTAVVINTGGGGMPALVEGERTRASKGSSRVSPFMVPAFMPNLAACAVSMEFGIKGPIICSAAACASALYAYIDAKRLLRSGDVDVVLAGGSESAIDPLAFAALGNLGALSHRNHDPARASRPFDRDRDGFVFGEGAGVMVLETEEHARRRGARIYAELAGGAITADAFHITAPDPTGFSPALAMQRALADGGLVPEDIDYICAHGTATPLNDVSETKSIKKAFGEHAYEVAISSPKSMVGHLLGAAGAISAAAAILAVHDGVVPPTINLENPDPECDLDYVPNTARQMPVRAALANGFGFGGQNAVVAFKAYRG